MRKTLCAVAAALLTLAGCHPSDGEAWDGAQLSAWRAYFAGEGPEPGNPSVRLLEAGQYRDTLPDATRVIDHPPFPIVTGRTLGLRVRYDRELTDFYQQALVLQRPDQAGRVVEEYRLLQL